MILGVSPLLHLLDRGGGGLNSIFPKFSTHYNFLVVKNQPLLFIEEPSFKESNNNKFAENVIYFKTKLNTKWMDFNTTAALKETVLTSFEYYWRASGQFLCSASWMKPSTCLDSFSHLNTIEGHQNSFFVVRLEWNHPLV